MSGITAGEGEEMTTGFGATGTGQRSPGEIARAAADTVKGEVATFASDAREKVADQAQGAAETATRTLGEFAAAIKKAGDELSQHDQSMAGKMVKQAGDGLENLARSMADKGPEELMDAAREFGRRNPVAFVAGGLLLGLAAGRFLRSSTPSTSGSAAPDPRAFSAGEAYQGADDGFGGPASTFGLEAPPYGASTGVDTDPSDATSISRPPYSPGV
jgi:hypothetical protein